MNSTFGYWHNIMLYQAIFSVQHDKVVNHKHHLAWLSCAAQHIFFAF